MAERDDTELAARRGCFRFATVGLALVAVAASIAGIVLLPRLRLDPRVEPDFQRVEAAFEAGVAKGSDDLARDLAHDLRKLANDPGCAAIVLAERAADVTRVNAFVRLSARPSKKERVVLAPRLVEAVAKRLDGRCVVYAEVRVEGEALRWARTVRGDGQAGFRTGSNLLAEAYLQGGVALIGSIR